MKQRNESPSHEGQSLQAFCAHDLSIVLQKLGQVSGVIAFCVGSFVGPAVSSCKAIFKVRQHQIDSQDTEASDHLLCIHHTQYNPAICTFGSSLSH